MPYLTRRPSICRAAGTGGSIGPEGPRGSTPAPPPHLPHLLPTAVPIVDSDDQRRARLAAARRVEQSTLGLVIAAGAGYRRAPVLTNLHKEVDGLG